MKNIDILWITSPFPKITEWHCICMSIACILIIGLTAGNISSSYQLYILKIDPMITP